MKRIVKETLKDGRVKFIVEKRSFLGSWKVATMQRIAPNGNEFYEVPAIYDNYDSAYFHVHQRWPEEAVLSREIVK